MYLPYFGQDLESKKKMAGILAHVCIWQSFQISQYFQNKGDEIRGEIGIFGLMVLTHPNPSPPQSESIPPPVETSWRCPWLLVISKLNVFSQVMGGARLHMLTCSSLFLSTTAHSSTMTAFTGDNIQKKSTPWPS